MTDRATATFDGALGIAGRWMTPPPSPTFEQLQNLVQAYALFTDAGQVAQLAELFTTDASWDGTRLGFGTSAGATAIAAHVCAHHRIDAPMMHLPGPALLSAVSDSEVEGVTWCTATRWVDGTTRPVIHFYYEDNFWRGEDGMWRFRRRRLHAAFPT